LKSRLVGFVIRQRGAVLFGQPPYQSPARDPDEQVLSCRPIHAFSLPGSAILGNQSGVVKLCDEIVQIVIGLQEDITSAPPISSARAAFGDEGFTVEGHSALTSMPCLSIDSYFVDKHVAARNMGRKKARLRASPFFTNLRLIGSWRGRGCDTDPPTVLFKCNLAVYQREERPITPRADILAGHKFRSALAHEDAACGDELTSKPLHTKPFADAVSSVADAALTFLVCHNSLKF
jgi:hypothetical protein